MLITAGPFDMPRSALITAALAFSGAIIAENICSTRAVTSEFWLGLIPGMYYIGILSIAINFPVRYALAAGVLAAIGHAAAPGFTAAHARSAWANAVLFPIVALAAGWFGRLKNIQSITNRKIEQTRRPEYGKRTVPIVKATPALKYGSATLLHQLRTPLASIEGAAFVLQDAQLVEGRRKEFVEIVLRECSRLRALLRSIDFNEIHPGDAQGVQPRER